MHLRIFNTKMIMDKMGKNEFLYELKNLLWLNSCNNDFDSISKDLKCNQFQIDKYYINNNLEIKEKIYNQDKQIT